MSTCDHDHRQELVANEQQDLTQTTTLHRREFAPALTKRFRRLKGLIRETVSYPNDAVELAAAEPREQFQFTEDEDAVSAFEAWLATAIAEDVLERVPLRRVRRGQHYTGPYVRSAYLRGIQGAERRLREAGLQVGDTAVEATFQMPIHQRTIQTIYTRTYSNLEGITDDVQEAVRDELSTALSQGWNPKKAASQLNDEVDDIGITRARTLSRTEISNAYNTASARRYESSSVSEVRILTSDPCPICEALAAADPYPVSEAASLIPGRTHPRCVCTIAPVV